MMSGSLLANLRQQSRRISSIIKRRHFNCGAYSTSAGSLVSRNSGIVSNKVEDHVAPKKRWELIADEIARIHSNDKNVNPEESVILVAPLIQVFSISIHHDSSGGQTPIGIHGCIHAIEEEGSSFSLYDRVADDFETVSNQGNLSLTGPEDCALLCRNVTTLTLHLREKKKGVDIFSSQLVLRSNKDEIDATCDKLIKAVVQGEHGFAAHVYYTTFSYAAFGHVMIGLVEKYDKSCDFVDIHGSIVAGYAHTVLCYAKNDDLEDMKTLLFNKPPDQTIRTMVPSARPIPLSRNIVAVPAYGKLKIEVDLRESGLQFVAGCVEFDVFDCGQYVKFVVGDLGVVSVEVIWEERVITNKEHYRWKRNVECTFPSYLAKLKYDGCQWLTV